MVRRIGWGVYLLIGLLPVCAQAQDWLVTKLGEAGDPAEVVRVHWSTDRTQPMRPRELRVDDKLAEGGELRAPTNVEVEVRSPKGMSVRKRAGDRGTLRVNASGRQGESAEVLDGRFSFVRKAAVALEQKLDPFTAGAGAAQAMSRTTEFTVAVDAPACQVRFAVQEGEIQVSIPVLNEVNGLEGEAGWTQRRRLKAGDPELSLPLAPGGWVRRFDSLDAALATYELQAREAQTRLDTDARIDALIALGDLLVLAGRPLEAKRYFQIALPLVPASDDLVVGKALQDRLDAAERPPRPRPQPEDPGYAALQARIQALNDGRRPMRDYYLAKAQCWFDVSRHEFLRHDRSGFAREAMAESEKLVRDLENGATPDAATKLIAQAQRLRPDLWSRAATLKSHPGARCAADKLACAEVRLVHAGQEWAQQQWRHAQPYVQMAEDLLGEAEALARSCPPEAAVAPAPPGGAPGPSQPPAGAGAGTIGASVPSPLVRKLSYSADAFFDLGQAQLKPEGRARLIGLVEKTRGLDLETVVVVGHTDSSGSEATNDALSLRRAAAVRDFLTRQGLPAGRIFIQGKGGRAPVADNRTAIGRAANRRVEVEVIGSGRVP